MPGYGYGYMPGYGGYKSGYGDGYMPGYNGYMPGYGRYGDALKEKAGEALISAKKQEENKK